MGPKDCYGRGHVERPPALRLWPCIGFDKRGRAFGRPRAVMRCSMSATSRPIRRRVSDRARQLCSR